MKFRKDQLVSTRDLLSELYIDGFELVSYPRDRDIYKGNEIYCFIHHKDAEEHAHLNGDWCVELL